MNTTAMWFLLLLMSVRPVEVLAASGQVDPTKPGGPAARDDTLGAPPPQSPSKTPSGEGKKATRPERIQRISGVVISVTSLDVVVSEPLRKEKKTVRFVMRPDTVKEGELRPGAQVNVDYQVEGDKNIAKRIRVQAERARRQR